MKYIYPFGQYLIIFLLFTGCASKEIFYFSKNTGSFGPYQKTQKINIHPDSLALLSESTESAQTSNDSLVLTASATNVVSEFLPKQEQVISFNSRSSQPGRKSLSNKHAVKNRVPLNFKVKKQLIEPEAKKRVQGSAVIGFILGLAAVGIILGGSFLAFAFGLAGAIFGIIGLSTIKKNPEKFSGRGFAWVGIGVGILIPLFILGFLLAFAGAF